jgi:hypothetical protein
MRVHADEMYPHQLHPRVEVLVCIIFPDTRISKSSWMFSLADSFCAHKYFHPCGNTHVEIFRNPALRQREMQRIGKLTPIR